MQKSWFTSAYLLINLTLHHLISSIQSKILEIYLQVSQGRSAKARAKDIFDSLDGDGDGELTMNEFVDGYLAMMVDS